MTCEELAERIHDGDREKLMELWTQVEKFVGLMARKRLVLSNGMGGVEFEDLYNSGYIALVAAVDSYDPDTGRSFIGWFAFHLKTAFAEAGGYRSRKQARDPLHHAGSLDTPLGDDEGEANTLGDFIPDPDAVQAFQDVEDQLYLEQLHDALDRVLETLGADEEAAIRARYYQGRTLAQIGPRGPYMVSTAIRKLRRPQIRRELRQFVEERTPYFGNWGAHTLERTTEMIVLKREQFMGNGGLFADT